MKNNPTKNFALIEKHTVFDQMKVMNPILSPTISQMVIQDRWHALYEEQILHKLTELAGKTPRNIILEPAHSYKRARRHQAGVFQAFGTRKCVTIVNEEKTLAQRTASRERADGKHVSAELVNDLRAKFTTPALDEGFTHLEWPELPEADARAMINGIRRGGLERKRQNPAQALAAHNSAKCNGINR